MISDIKPDTSANYSSESDSDDTVILPDEEWTAPPTPRTRSFLRFLSRDGQADATDSFPVGQLIHDYTHLNHTKTTSITTDANRVNYPSDLSFLQAYPSFTSMFNSGEPGSFSFKDCRLQLTRNKQAMINQTNETAQTSAIEDVSTDSGSASSQGYYDYSQASENIQPCQATDPESKQFGYIPIMPVPGAPPSIPTNSVPLKSIMRNKNREAAKKCRQKKKNYLQQLEQDYKKLQEQYAICRQENDDLKRLIFQQLNFNLSHQNQQQSEPNFIAPISIQSNNLIGSSINTLSNIAPAPSSNPTAPTPIQIRLVGVPIAPTTDQSSVTIKLVQTD